VVQVERPEGRPPTPGELLHAVLPRGSDLAQPLWRARHRALLGLLVAHVLLLPLWALLNSEPFTHVLGLEAGLVGLVAVGANARSRALAASAVALGLVASAAAVVHAGDGRSVLHFHFFVVVAALALYQRWTPFLLALGFVIVDHAVMGLLAPEDVYDDAFSLQSPWLAAAVHGGYVLCAAAAAALAWTWAERERRSAEERAEQEASRVRESERRLAGLLDNVPASIFVKDLQGRFVDANRQMKQVLGVDGPGILGRTSADLFGPVAATVSDAHDAQVVATRASSEVVERNRLAGEERVLSVVKFPLLDDSGTVTAIAGIASDITERTVAEQALRDSERRLRGVFARGPVAQMVLQADGTLAEVNPAFCDLFGYDEDELLGMRLAALVVPEERGTVGALLVPTAEPQRQELRMRTRGREVLSCKVGVAAVAVEDGPSLLRRMVEDVTQARRSAAELDHRATHDSLTGLPNRALLLSRIGAGLAEPARCVALVFLDLDGFKEVNDSLGHDAGDQLLHTVGRRLDAVRRPGDTLARLGGDEFVLCCPDLEAPEQARAVADRMLAVLRNPLSVADRTVEVGGSIGIALGRARDGATPMLLLRDADTALYAAKAEGRNRAVVFTPALRERDERRRPPAGDLAAALRGGGGLWLAYQPVAEAATGSPRPPARRCVRWEHPDDGALMPDAFLPLAADKGLLPLLDRWVLDEACAARRPGRRTPGRCRRGEHHPQTHRGGGVVDWVRAACARHGLCPGPAGRRAHRDGVVTARETSRTRSPACAPWGCGWRWTTSAPGYSSLSHLRDLPVDVVKIDRSFTRGAGRSRRDAAIVQASRRSGSCPRRDPRGRGRGDRRTARGGGRGRLPARAGLAGVGAARRGTPWRACWPVRPRLAPARRPRLRSLASAPRAAGSALPGSPAQLGEGEELPEVVLQHERRQHVPEHHAVQGRRCCAGAKALRVVQCGLRLPLSSVIPLQVRVPARRDRPGRRHRPEQLLEQTVQDVAGHEQASYGLARPEARLAQAGQPDRQVDLVADPEVTGHLRAAPGAEPALYRPEQCQRMAVGDGWHEAPRARVLPVVGVEQLAGQRLVHARVPRAQEQAGRRRVGVERVSAMRHQLLPTAVGRQVEVVDRRPGAAVGLELEAGDLLAARGAHRGRPGAAARRPGRTIRAGSPALQLPRSRRTRASRVADAGAARPPATSSATDKRRPRTADGPARPARPPPFTPGPPPAPAASSSSPSARLRRRRQHAQPRATSRCAEKAAWQSAQRRRCSPTRRRAPAGGRST
jgi:diguanylate cyclase (GGDEF)-like protein/PAS domain S-box-containing protein